MSKSTSPQPPYHGAASSSAVSSSSSVTSPMNGRSKSKSPAVKPPNVFSNDGSFLDRIRRSIQEEEDKQREKEALERKKKFADRFKNRRKRPASPQDPPSNSDVTPEEEQENPTKKLRLADEKENSNVHDANDKHASAQAEYHKAVDSYTSSLKDSGTGIRPLVK